MYFSSRFTRDDLTNSFEFNTYDDWFLIPTSRPVIQPPKPKVTATDVPGANGMLDLSRSLTGFPVFMNRQGTNEYMIENDKWPKWLDALTEITNKLDGQYLRMYFEDEEPEYYYVGTWSIASWQTGDVYSTITIEYDLFPYKMKDQYSGLESQLWDTFNFNKDYIVVTTDGEWRAFKVTVNENNQNGILFNSRDPLLSQDLVGLFGEMPITPKISVHNVADLTDWQILLQFTNNELGIEEEKTLSGTASQTDIDIPEFIMTMFNPQMKGTGSIPEQLLSLRVTRLTGNVTVTCRFMIGRL